MYERVNFHPPDLVRPQYDEDIDDSSSSRKRKARPADLVPSSYHPHIHHLSGQYHRTEQQLVLLWG